MARAGNYKELKEIPIYSLGDLGVQDIVMARLEKERNDRGILVNEIIRNDFLNDIRLCIQLCSVNGDYAYFNLEIVGQGDDVDIVRLDIHCKG